MKENYSLQQIIDDLRAVAKMPLPQGIVQRAS